MKNYLIGLFLLFSLNIAFGNIHFDGENTNQEEQLMFPASFYDFGAETSKSVKKEALINLLQRFEQDPSFEEKLDQFYGGNLVNNITDYIYDVPFELLQLRDFFKNVKMTLLKEDESGYAYEEDIRLDSKFHFLIDSLLNGDQDQQEPEDQIEEKNFSSMKNYYISLLQYVSEEDLQNMPDPEYFLDKFLPKRNANMHGKTFEEWMDEYYPGSLDILIQAAEKKYMSDEVQVTDCNKEKGVSGIDVKKYDKAKSCFVTGKWEETGIMKNNDFLLKRYQTCMKSQDSRGTCYAFTLAAVAETTHFRDYKGPVNFSEQYNYFWLKIRDPEEKRYSDMGAVGLHIDKAVNDPDKFWREFSPDDVASYSAPGMRELHFNWERIWPYNSNDGLYYNKTKKTRVGSCNGYGHHCYPYQHQSTETDYTLGDGRNVKAFGAPFTKSNYIAKRVYKLHKGESGEAPSDFELERVKIALKLGIPVSGSVFIKKDLFYRPKDGYIVHDGTNWQVRGLGGHQIAFMGYVDKADLPPGAPTPMGPGYFIIKNSWNTNWGDCGYAYIDYNYLLAYGGRFDIFLTGFK